MDLRPKNKEFIIRYKREDRTGSFIEVVSKKELLEILTNDKNIISYIKDIDYKLIEEIQKTQEKDKIKDALNRLYVSLDLE